MRLLHVICTTNPESGGPIESLLRFSEVLMRDGHAVSMVSLETEAEIAGRQYPFPVIGVGNGLGRYRYNPRLVSWLRENAGNFDAVILHGLWNYSSLGSWRALRDHPTPYFLFVHGMLDPWFRQQYPLKHVAKQMLWWLGEGSVLRDARAVLFTCEEERIRARNAFLGPSYREQVVLYGAAAPDGNPDDERSAFRAAFPALQGKRFLLYLSRIHLKKGCDLLIRAFAKNIANAPPDMDLVIAGPDQAGWVAELQRIAKRLGVARRIHWPGMLTGAVKWGAFRSADAFILPSHQENFGIVVAEAMACATPVLISDKVNIWREVTSAGAGIVEPDTQAGINSLIQRYLALTDEERSVMRKNAERAFAQFFDVEMAARSFMSTIESYLQQDAERNLCAQMSAR